MLYEGHDTSRGNLAVNELLTPEEMGRADTLAISAGTSGFTLMKHAGVAVADEIATRRSLGTRVTIVCGPGNNGGDGFVAARILKQRGYPVRILLYGERSRIAGDAGQALEQWSGDVDRWSGQSFDQTDCVIDALFGAGLSRPVTGEAAELISAINASDAEIISVDLPSGINGADGSVLGIAVNATRTVTFFRKKPGHCLYPGKRHCGVVRLVDIGIPVDVLDEIEPAMRENSLETWKHLWHPPVFEGHKYSRGHCVAVSGPYWSTGAIRLAARAALRTGAGLVTIASPQSALAINASHATSVMTKGFDTLEAFSDLIGDRRISAVVIGPGLGLPEDNRDLVCSVLRSEAFVVLDADALTLFAGNSDDLFKVLATRPSNRTVLTPHGGEFTRLFPGVDKDHGSSKPDRARAAATMAHATVLLKGPDTVIAAPDRQVIINHDSSPWLATAGSGDVLAGILAGLGAQGIPGFEAAAMAAWMHNAAALHAGPGLIAEDLVEAIKNVVVDLDGIHRGI